MDALCCKHLAGRLVKSWHLFTGSSHVVAKHTGVVHVCVQEAKHWEAAFQVYEKGTSLFKYPHVADIWAAYLKSFVAR